MKTNRVERAMSQYKETRALYEWFGPHMWGAWAIFIIKLVLLIYFCNLAVDLITDIRSDSCG